MVHREQIINLTKNTTIVSPSMVPFEIANGLTKMMRKKIIVRAKKHRITH
jgi:hypothetical protein